MRLTKLFCAMFGLMQSSCVVVGGYSEEGGWYVWPGSLLLTGAALVLLFLFVRRRR